MPDLAEQAIQARDALSPLAREFFNELTRAWFEVFENIEDTPENGAAMKEAHAVYRLAICAADEEIQRDYTPCLTN